MQLILVALGAWFIAQIIKFSIRAFNGQPNFRVFYQSGGMPSAHSATVIALATAALTTQGYQSPIFGLSVVIAAIVIYDSLGVRRSSGEQSVVINALLRTTGKNSLVREILGHTPSEVVAGSAVGIVTGLLFTYGEWAENLSWLAESPTDAERLVYLGVFAGIVLLGIALRIALTRFRSVDVIGKVSSVAWNAFMLPGFFGLLTSLLQFQTGRAGSWRLWSVIVIVVFFTVQLILTWKFYFSIKKKYEEQSSKLKQLRKHQRRLDKKNKKSKRRKK